MSMSMGGGGVKAEPNVTPMIDVMLVLLIIFMIVIPQINAGFAAVPPKGQNLAPHPEEDNDQVLGIDALGQYYLNKKVIPNEQLETVLKGIYDLRQVDKILFLKAHNEIQYEKVIDALDIAAKAGVRQTGMISDQLPNTKSAVASDNVGFGQPKAAKP